MYVYPQHIMTRVIHQCKHIRVVPTDSNYYIDYWYWYTKQPCLLLITIDCCHISHIPTNRTVLHLTIAEIRDRPRHLKSDFLSKTWDFKHFQATKMVLRWGYNSDPRDLHSNVKGYQGNTSDNPPWLASIGWGNQTWKIFQSHDKLPEAMRGMSSVLDGSDGSWINHWMLKVRTNSVGLGWCCINNLFLLSKINLDWSRNSVPKSACQSGQWRI